MNKQRIFVAGHRGMVGSAIVRQLAQRGDVELVLRTRDELDLLDGRAVQAFFAGAGIDQVYLAAAKVGGIVANNTYPADFIYENMMIESNIIHAAHLHNVNKLLFLGSSCIYPKLLNPNSSFYMEKSKILILTPRFPYPVVGGDRLRIYRICKELSKYYTLDLLSLCDSIEDLNFIVKNDHVFDKIFRIYHPKIKSYFNVLKALPGRKPLQIAYYKNTEFENKLNEIIGNYDLTLSHLIRVGDYTLNKPGLHILEMTDAISLNYSRIKKEAPKNSLKSIIYSIEQERLLKYEKEVYGRYSLISLISEVDKKFLFGNRNDNILVCNNGVDLEDYPFTKRVIENTNIINLIFIGNLCSFQNFDGVKWFVKNILPSINKNNNGKKYIFHILGKINKSDKLYLQGFENVVVSGSVTNMADAAKIGHIGICPVRFGAGVQNKILEYMALGLPTITSRMGYEGIEANIGEEILIADNSDEYLKSLETLSENSVYQMIAKNARNFVAEKFNWSTRLSVLVKNIERLTGK